MGPPRKAAEDGLEVARQRGLADHRVFPASQTSIAPTEAEAREEALMPIRRYRRDPRSEPQRRADDEVLAAFERGDFLRVPASVERAAIEAVRRRQTERRQFAASLGVRLGLLRRAHAISQQQLARVLGTTKSNISRLESGREGGLTVERFVAVEDAVQLLAGRAIVRGGEEGLVRLKPLDRFRKPTDALEMA